MSLFVLDPLGIWRVIRYEASCEDIIPGDVNQRLNTCECAASVGDGLGGACYCIAKCFGSKVMAGPDRGVATARVIDDLIAGGTVEYRIQKREVREVAF